MGNPDSFDHALASVTSTSVINVPVDPKSPPVIDVRAVPAEPPPVEVRAESKPAPIGLTWLDEKAFKGLIVATDEILDRLVSVVHGNANGLCDLRDRDNARLRVLSRAIAVTRAKVLIYEAQIDAFLSKRDTEAVELTQKVLNGANKRLIALVAEHRNECSNVRSPVTIAVGQQVNVIDVHR